MTTPAAQCLSYSLEDVIDSHLIANSLSLAREFSQNQPFPHVIIPRILLPEVASFISSKVTPLPDRSYGVSFNSLAQRKLQLGNLIGVVPETFGVYEALMGPVFTNFIETVSGYPGLQADRAFTGAGLQRYKRGGFSEIHVDSNRHPFDVRLHHRVNLLIFLNPVWRSEWGGELVLWSSRSGRPHKPESIIAPEFNRGVLFAVAKDSWHSVNAIRAPRDRARNSMAIYYFNRIANAHEEPPRSVIWYSTRGWPSQALFEITNRAINIAKPYAKYLRWLRSNKFDGFRKDRGFE